MRRKIEKDTFANTPHGIVAGLMKNFPFTLLQPDIDREPKKFAPATRFGGPQYFEDNLGGAWPIAEHIELSAEGQAISRFVSGVLHQVGVPGTTETILVYADERDGGERALTERFQRGVPGGLGRPKYERKRTHKESGERLRDRDGNPLEITEHLQLMRRFYRRPSRRLSGSPHMGQRTIRISSSGRS